MNKILNSNEFYLGYSSKLKIFFAITYLAIFVPIIAILITQKNYIPIGIFVLIGLIVFFALCFERDMIVEICQDGIVITKTATIYQKEEKFYISNKNITNIHVNRVLGKNYYHDVYVICSKGNSNIELLPIDKKNLRLKYYLDNLNAKFASSDNNYAKLNEKINKKEKVISKWKMVCFVLIILLGVLFRIIKAIIYSP